MNTLNDIRAAFLGFFESNGHVVLPSSSLVPHNDPTLMFTNAGMVPFKNVFSGQEHLKTSDGKAILRAATSQKCVRAGGKHNDLDNVGYTARHHTFFEMLGNFSFGDYFKTEAIEYAWKFLTKTLGISPEKLYITVFHTDDEAFDIWKKITGFSDDKIIRIATKDNFWAMGDTGPCGPCSEIFYDHGVGKGTWALDHNGNDMFDERYVEIWNLVFMQYEQLEDKRENLPKPCIDTGAGLERLAALMQGVHDNYETEMFRALIASSQEISKNNGDKFASSHRVIADHLRSCSFLLADGVMPSNEGRGYVLRRIMRRAMRHAYILGCKEPLMYKLVPSLMSEMSPSYPELQRAEALITETLKLEEERFKETLGRGIKLLEGAANSLNKGDKLSGSIAFKLYDTYGFPLDLTEDILRNKNISVDKSAFNSAMEKQKAKARAAWSGSGDSTTSEIWFDIREKSGATEFLGYTTLEATGSVIAIVKNGEQTDKAVAGEDISIITNQTPFYAESGGQTGDKGSITTNNSVTEINIQSTKKHLVDLFVHTGKVLKGEVKTGDSALMKVDKSIRDNIRANHSATHLLHMALHKHIGEHVTQKGSLVEENYFRFDFNHQKGLSYEELTLLENEVNSFIKQNTKTVTHIMTPDEAIKQGAMALFGEKYGDEVRVVSMGKPIAESKNIKTEKTNKEHYSVELCGGTHVERTGDIGLFKIIKESAVAAGIRRIEAVTGTSAIAYIKEQQNNLREISSILKSSPNDAASRVRSILNEQKKLESELAETKKKLAMGGGISSDDDKNKPEKVGNISFISRKLVDVSPKDLRGIVDDFKRQIQSGIIVLIANNDGKASIVVGVTGDLTDHISAVDLVRIGSTALDGKGGGGRPDFAQAGGSNAENADIAISEIKKAISRI